MTEHSDHKANKRSRIILTLLIAIFAIPMLAAWYLYHHSAALHLGTTNHGQLIKPPIAITELPITNSQGILLQNEPDTSTDPSLNINGHWMLLSIVPESCGHRCRQSLYYMRQIRIATGKNRNRVTRAVLLLNPTTTPLIKQIIKQAYPGTKLMLTNKAAFSKVFSHKHHIKGVVQAGTLLIVDPRDNIMMAYQPDANPTDILEDLTHLLKISQIG